MLGPGVAHVNRAIQELRRPNLATLARRGAVDRAGLLAMATHAKA